MIGHVGVPDCFIHLYFEMFQNYLALFRTYRSSINKAKYICGKHEEVYKNIFDPDHFNDWM